MTVRRLLNGVSDRLLELAIGLHTSGLFSFSAETSSATDELELNVIAVHPLTGNRIPVFVVASRDYGQFNDVNLGIPSCSEEDREFAVHRGLEFVEVYDDEKLCVLNSDQFSGLPAAEAFTAISDYAKKLGYGGHVTSEKARDWLISRQRYWGTPIPIVHCKKYGAVPVAYEDLPVTLPTVTKLHGHEDMSPLASADQWLAAKCAKCDCDGFGRRETDTMDTFVDSSWYFLRYLNPDNHSQLISPAAAQLMPVDLYIGGKEHAIMHLYYARFMSHFLHDIGLVPTREPFVDLLTQGMVMGRSCRLQHSGKYLRPHEVEWTGPEPVEAQTNEKLIVEWEKMSKSKYNGVDPQEVINEFGVDTTRLCLLSNVAPKSDRLWSHDVFVGVLRWQGRIWALVSKLIAQRKFAASQTSCSMSSEQLDQIEDDIFNARNIALKEVTFHMNKTYLFNAAISRLHTLTTELKSVPVEAVGLSVQYERALADLVVMICPFVPMFASELWTGLATVADRTPQLDWTKSVLEQRWPTLDDDFKIPMSVRLNGSLLFDVRLPMSHSDLSALSHLTECEAMSLARQHQQFEALVGNKLIIGQRLVVQQDNCHVTLDLTVAVDKKKSSSSAKRLRHVDTSVTS